MWHIKKLPAYFPSLAFCKSPNNFSCLINPQWLQCIYLLLSMQTQNDLSKEVKTTPWFCEKNHSAPISLTPTGSFWGLWPCLMLQQETYFWLRLSSLECVDLTGILSSGVCIEHGVPHLSVPCKITFVIFNIWLVSYLFLLHNFKNINVEGIKYVLNCVMGAWNHVHFGKELSKLWRGMIK